MPSLRAVVQIDDLIVYESMSDAAKSYGKTPAMIMRAAECGTRCGGKRWRFKVDDDPVFGGLVVCDQTDEGFANCARAAKTFGVSVQEIYGSVLYGETVDERYTFSVEDHRGDGAPVRGKLAGGGWRGRAKMERSGPGGDGPAGRWGLKKEEAGGDDGN